MSKTFTYDNNEDIRNFVEKYKFDIKDFKGIFINCEYYETRNSWGHRGGVRVPTQYSDVVKHKIRYYNRTWECYTYQTLLLHLLDDYATYLTGINYHNVYLMNNKELNDLKTMKLKDFQAKHPFYKGAALRETKKHYKRIELIK